MRKLLTLKFLVYIFFLTNTVFSNEWSKVTKGLKGHTFYVDMQQIKEEKNYIYFWQLINYEKADEYGDYSAKIYMKADCVKLRFRWMKLSYHKSFMAEDKSLLKKPSDLVAGWQSPEKGSTSFTVIEHVCKNKGLVL